MGEKLQFTELDQYLFGQGTHYDIYRKLGAHPTIQRRKKGVYFAVWAPNAAAVSIVGDFNEWDENATPMERLEPLGIYQIFLTGIKVGDIYKYCVTAQDGKKTLKADPYGFQAELRPNNASVVADISDFKWHDSRWMKKREKNAEHSGFSLTGRTDKCHNFMWSSLKRDIFKNFCT